MSSTATPADPLAQLSFELERFQWAGEERLEVTGRWFGVRGRRFVRPTLTLRAGGRRRRLIAVLDHKPWAANEEEHWTAAFAWRGPHEEITTARLEVAPDVVLELPSPGDIEATTLHPRPRRRPAPATTIADAPAAPTAVSPPAATPEPPAAPVDVTQVREEAERAAQERAAAEVAAAEERLGSELASAQAELEAAQQRIAALSEHEATAVERANEVVRLEGELAAAQAVPERSKRELVEARRRAERAEQMTAGLRQRVTDANNLTARLERRLVEAAEQNERLQQRIAELQTTPEPPPAPDATVEFTAQEAAAVTGEPPADQAAPAATVADTPPAPAPPPPTPPVADLPPADPAVPPLSPRRRTRGDLYAHPGEPHSWAARGVALALVAVLLLALIVLIFAVL